MCRLPVSGGAYPPAIDPAALRPGEFSVGTSGEDTIGTHTYREDERIHSFSGVSVGLWGTRVYALKVYLERLADAGDRAAEDQLRQEINVNE